jgi:hypothetical protein
VTKKDLAPVLVRLALDDATRSLERIALGVTGRRREGGLQDNEKVYQGTSHQWAKSDWQLAEDCLARIQETSLEDGIGVRLL